jgi:hypothetical protein
VAATALGATTRHPRIARRAGAARRIIDQGKITSR